MSSEGWCESNNNTLVKGDSVSASPKTGFDNIAGAGPGAGVSSITVASPAEMSGTPAPKRGRTGQVIGEEELKWERELQRKRLGKMLDTFPDEKALTFKEKPKDESVEPRTEEPTAIVVSKS